MSICEDCREPLPDRESREDRCWHCQVIREDYMEDVRAEVDADHDAATLEDMARNPCCDHPESV